MPKVAKAWVYFLHEKSEAFVMFKTFKTYVEKEVGVYITCLRRNKGGEFSLKEFEIFLMVKEFPGHYLRPILLSKMESLKGKKR